MSKSSSKSRDARSCPTVEFCMLIWASESFWKAEMRKNPTAVCTGSPCQNTVTALLLYNHSYSINLTTINVACLWWLCMFCLCLCGFSLDATASLTIPNQNLHVRLIEETHFSIVVSGRLEACLSSFALRLTNDQSMVYPASLKKSDGIYSPDHFGILTRDYPAGIVHFSLTQSVCLFFFVCFQENYVSLHFQFFNLFWRNQ